MTRSGGHAYSQTASQIARHSQTGRQTCQNSPSHHTSIVHKQAGRQHQMCCGCGARGVVLCKPSNWTRSGRPSSGAATAPLPLPPPGSSPSPNREPAALATRSARASSSAVSGEDGGRCDEPPAGAPPAAAPFSLAAIVSCADDAVLDERFLQQASKHRRRSSPRNTNRR